MKKIILLLTTALFAFSSCSSDSDMVGEVESSQKHTVTFRAEMSSISIEASPLRAAVQEGEPTFYTCIIYKENGERFFDYFYNTEKKTGSTNVPEDEFLLSYNNSSLSGKFELPNGKYIISLLVHRKDSKHSDPLSDLSFLEDTFLYPTNFNTDMYGKYYYAKSNSNIYYSYVSFTVAGDNSQKISMQLEPMWSYLNININDAQSFDVPEGTNAVQFNLNPMFSGFGIKSKLAFLQQTDSMVVILDTIRKNATFNLNAFTAKTLPENNNISVAIKYLKQEKNMPDVVLETRNLDIPNTIVENGQIYNINGNLGSKNSGQSMNISLGEFNKEDVVIEF